MAYNPKDFYFKKAKEKNFAARSVFKLEEIDERFKIVKSGYKVLDLGCAPGSWAQYTSQKVGSNGFVLGIDLQKVNLSLPNARLVQGDAFDQQVLSGLMAEASVKEFDLVLSDMAPKTTGIRIQDQQRSLDLALRALDVARINLRVGGHFVVKLFQSEDFDRYLADLRTSFEKVEILRPKSTRKASYEIFLIGLRKRRA